MKNEMNEIPTPETDAAEMCVKHTHRMLYDEDKVVESDKMRDLERRLTIARETLMAIADKSVNLDHAERMADRALKLTARNPKP